MVREASEELVRHVLAQGRPVKDEDWEDGDWRDFDWDHAGNGCGGWQTTAQSEVVEIPLDGGVLVMVTHCRCACRVHPHVTVGVER